MEKDNFTSDDRWIIHQCDKKENISYYSIEPSYRRLVTYREFQRYIKLLQFLNGLSISIVSSICHLWKWSKRVTESIFIQTDSGQNHLIERVHDRYKYILSPLFRDSHWAVNQWTEDMLLNHWVTISSRPSFWSVSLSTVESLRASRWSHINDETRLTNYCYHCEQKAARHGWYSRTIRRSMNIGELWKTDEGVEVLITHHGNCYKHDQPQLDDLQYMGIVTEYIRDVGPSIDLTEIMD
jgi:hypothetical protein